MAMSSVQQQFVGCEQSTLPGVLILRLPDGNCAHGGTPAAAATAAAASAAAALAGPNCTLRRDLRERRFADGRAQRPGAAWLLGGGLRTHTSPLSLPTSGELLAPPLRLPTTSVSKKLHDCSGISLDEKT